MPDNFYDKPDDDVELTKLGEQLRDLRVAQGLSYDDVAKATHVRPYILKAIEEGCVHDFAAPVYARGFVKTYCGHLMADDLWKKYIQHLPSRDAPKVKRGVLHASASINHPTPIFRRSSIIWVYMILVLAVFAAAFLLWNQHSRIDQSDSGFFLKNPQESDNGRTASPASEDERPIETLQNEIISGDGIASQDLPTSGQDEQSATSQDQASSAVPSSDNGMGVDLSWLDGTQSPQTPSSEISVLQSQIPDRKLLIEIRKPARLIVQQNGSVVTRRSMSAGGVRSYDVTASTPVSLSVGDAADITWYGKRYSPVGSNSGPLSLVFHPDGRVTVTEGRSGHFENRR